MLFSTVIPDDVNEFNNFLGRKIFKINKKLCARMSTIIAGHQSFLHTDRDRLNSAKSIFPTIWPAGTEKSSSSTPLVARVTHRARQRLTSHPPPQPASPGHLGAGVMASPAREVSVSAGPVSTICSEPPPPASVSRERTACPAPLVFLPIFTLSQTQRRGWGVVVMVGWGGGRRRGSSSGMLPTGAAGQQRKQEKYIFLSRRSPSKALYTSSILRPRLGCFPPPPPCPPLTLSFSHPNP